MICQRQKRAKVKRAKVHRALISIHPPALPWHPLAPPWIMAAPMTSAELENWRAKIAKEEKWRVG